MNYYATAIAELEKDHDWRAISVRFAQRYPKAFCDAARDCTAADADALPRVIQTALGSDPVANKIPAIKVYREATGASLGEAKRAVERFISNTHNSFNR
jgi:ribosomal protein L7/L12